MSQYYYPSDSHQQTFVVPQDIHTSHGYDENIACARRLYGSYNSHMVAPPATYTQMISASHKPLTQISEYQGEDVYAHVAHTESLGNLVNDCCTDIPPLAAHNTLDALWIFEDEVVPVSKPQDRGFLYNDDDDYYSSGPISSMECYPSLIEDDHVYYHDDEYLARSQSFTSNLHYPYGGPPHATSLAIADEGLAAACVVLGRNEWVKQRVTEHDLAVICEDQQIRTGPPARSQNSCPPTSSASVAATYCAVESVPVHMIVPSQHPYPERLDQYHASYQHPMYEAHRQSGFQEPEPIMDHLPFPEESTSPYSCSSDSSSAQSPYASHTGPSHSTISYGRQSHIKTDTIITTPTSSRACDSGEVHSTPVYSPPTYANYTMPTLWSSSLPLLSPKQAKDSHAPNRRHHSIRPKDPRPRRPSSPRPSKTRSLDAKPPLACLFCRGRKIACGPPPPGSDDKTCNQCFRRQLECEYPLESRRGIRKKKSSVSKINASGPKVVLKAPRKR